jgi:hypothetical protein
MNQQGSDSSSSIHISFFIRSIMQFIRTTTFRCVKENTSEPSLGSACSGKTIAAICCAILVVAVAHSQRPPHKDALAVQLLDTAMSTMLGSSGNAELTDIYISGTVSHGSTHTGMGVPFHARLHGKHYAIETITPSHTSIYTITGDSRSVVVDGTATALSSATPYD